MAAIPVLLTVALLAFGPARAEPGAIRRATPDLADILTPSPTPTICASAAIAQTICVGIPSPTATQRPQDNFVRLPIVQNMAGMHFFPDTTNGIFVFNDQLNTPGMTEAQFQFAATHYVGTQKVLRDAARHLRQYNPNFLVLHYRLGQALGHSIPSGACQPTTDYLQIIDGNQWVQEWPGDANVQESWFFHVNSSRVFSCANGHFLTELNDPGWRVWWSAQVIQQLQDNEDDGVFADSYSVPNYFGACGWRPCLPDVDATFEAEWAAREHDFTDYIRAQFAGRWKWIPNIGALITSALDSSACGGRFVTIIQLQHNANAPLSYGMLL